MRMSDSTILVVDDDPTIVCFLREALEDEGYEVVTAVDGEALPLAHDLHPSVILLDLMMSGMDGLEVSLRLRADPVTALIPIIAMSAQHNLEAAVARMPVNDHLPKPFELLQLYDTVARWARAPSGGRLRWHSFGGRSFAFDRTTRRVVAWCGHGVGTRWWVLIRYPAATHGPFATLEQARAEAEKLLLA
jgi:CheY-like chemotaxis protein